LALLGFDCQEANQPHSPYDQPVVLWATSDSEIGLLPLHVGYLFKTGYYKEPESSPTRDFPRIWVFEESKIYKWRWETRLQSGQSTISPIGWKIKTFLRGKKIG
jgi:hypothetical protein